MTNRQTMSSNFFARLRDLKAFRPLLTSFPIGFLRQSAWSKEGLLITLWMEFTMAASSSTSHFSTCPLALAVDIVCMSSTTSPSLLFMCVISRTSVNSTLAIPSKHFFKWGVTLVETWEDYGPNWMRDNPQTIGSSSKWIFPSCHKLWVRIVLSIASMFYSYHTFTHKTSPIAPSLVKPSSNCSQLANKHLSQLDDESLGWLSHALS